MRDSWEMYRLEKISSSDGHGSAVGKINIVLAGFGIASYLPHSNIASRAQKSLDSHSVKSGTIVFVIYILYVRQVPQ